MAPSAVVPGAVALGTGIVAVLVAGSGLRPLTRRWPAALAASLLAALATEIPRPTAGTVLVLEAEALRRGAVRSGAGRAGLGLAAVAVGVLGLLDVRARATGRVLDDALHAALGPRRASGPRARPRRPRLGDLAAERLRIVREHDVSYGDDPAQVLDVWRAGGLAPDARAPVVLQIHGGAWSAGAKEGDARPLLTHLADAGWVCVAADYRLGPDHRWPAMIDDVRAALAWTRAHVAERGGDPGRIVLTGGSAGAHLAALTALTDHTLTGHTPAGHTPAGHTPTGHTQTGRADALPVAAVVVSYGIYDLTRDDGSGTLADLLEDTMMPARTEVGAWRSASPTHQVHPGAPPFLVLHGTGDAVVSPDQSRRFVRALRAVSRAPVGYAELPHAQHLFDALPTARTLRVVAAVEEFLAAVVPRSEPGVGPAVGGGQ